MLVCRATLPVAFFTALLLTAFRPASADQFDAIRQRIQEEIDSGRVPSMAVAVASHGQIIWEQGFGLANREQKTPADEHTMYSLASISKPITAVGLMILVQQGHVDLDRPINDYLGDAKLNARVGKAEEATVRRVANHTAGLPLHYQFFHRDEGYPLPPRDETIRRYGNLVTGPGERFQYSNLGYGVLDYVITRVSGKPYAEFMREEVFVPLKLDHMAVGVPTELASHEAIRYTTDGQPISFYDFDHPGASAVYSSAHDLARFGMFVLKDHLADQKPILNDESIGAMLQATGNVGRGEHYGVGWFIGENDRGYRVVSHSGGMGGVNTILQLVPDEDLAVVVLANTSTPLPSRLASEIRKAVLPNRPRPEPTQAAEDPAPQSRPKEPEFPSELVGTWHGEVETYEGPRAVVLSIESADHVRIKLADQDERPLRNAKIADGFLRGQFQGDIGTPDVNRRPYLLHVELKLRGDVLNGDLIAISMPSARLGNALSHWVELRRQ